MSNPFATFRKNQKIWMAALVMVAIFAFVIAPAFDYARNAIGGSGMESTVAVRWNGGKMTVGDLRNRSQKHSDLVRFLSEVAKRVLEEGGRPDVPGFNHDPTTRQILGLGIQYSSQPQDLVRTKVLASYGQSLGVEFDNDAVDQFLVAYVDDCLSSEEVRNILRDASNGTLSYYEVRQLLKDELSSMVVQQMALSGLFAEDGDRQMRPLVSPGKTFDDFRKLNQTAKVEAFPVFVDEYIDQVTTDPTEEEIDAVYMIGSQLAPNPNSPEPGFIRLYKSNIEYVEASLQSWIDREKEKLTEEQIREEYDRRVELGQLQIPVGSTLDAGAATIDAESSTDDSIDASVPATDTPADTDAVPESSGADGSTPEAADEPPADDQSLRSGDTNLHYVAYQSSPDASDTTAQAATNLPPPVVQPPQLNSGETTEPSMRTQTFEEAREEIATSLARDAAIPALDEALTTLLEDHMRPYFGEYRQYEAFVESGMETENGEPRQPPAKPDLKQIAEDLGLTWAETGLIDASALLDTPFGQGTIRPDESGVSGSVTSVAMNPNTELYRPLQSSYFDTLALQQGAMPEFLQYLFWKTEEQAAFIPEKADIRDEIVDYWRQVKARAIAEEAARELAKKIGEGDDPWSAALSTEERGLVVETNPFTWMNQFGESIGITDVDMLDRVGGEFMQGVFATPVGQVGVAPNANKSKYYIFRVTEVAPADEDLQLRFQADPLKSGPKRIAFDESQRMFSSWVQNLEQELGVEWQVNLSEYLQ